MNALPLKRLALLTSLLLLETSPTLAAPQLSPLPSTNPVLLSQSRLRSRFPSRRRYPSRFRPRTRIRQRVTRPRQRLIPARSPRRLTLPRPKNRLTWSPSGRRPLQAPIYRWGGLARGKTACADKEISATALPPKIRQLPLSSNGDEQIIADTVEPQTTSNQLTNSQSDLDSQPNFDVTLQSHPTFWIHIADLPSTIAEFTIQNIEGTQQLYDAQFRIGGGTGMIGITMPNSAPPLETNQAYVWRVRLECDPDDPSKDVYVGNEVEYVAANDSEQVNERDRPAYYAKEGIWQDAISALALLRFNAPDDVSVKEEWELLVDADGLEMSEFKESQILQIF